MIYWESKSDEELIILKRIVLDFEVRRLIEQILTKRRNPLLCQLPQKLLFLPAGLEIFRLQNGMKFLSSTISFDFISDELFYEVGHSYHQNKIQHYGDFQVAFAKTNQSRMFKRIDLLGNCFTRDDDILFELNQRALFNSPFPKDFIIFIICSCKPCSVAEASSFCFFFERLIVFIADIYDQMCLKLFPQIPYEIRKIIVSFCV